MTILESQLVKSLQINKQVLNIFIDSMKVVVAREKDGQRLFSEEEVNKLKDHLDQFGLSTKEAAALVGVTEQTIKKRLEPWNKDTWRIDGTLLFHLHDVLELAAEIKKPGMTIKDIVAYIREKYHLKVSDSRIYNKIKNGSLPSEVIEYRGIDTYFVKKEDIDTNIQILFKTNQTAENFKDPFTGYYLYQPFLKKDSYEMARVMLQDGSLEAVTSNNEYIPLVDLEGRGFHPIYPIPKKKRISKKGFVTFTFHKPDNISSVVYLIIDLFYQNIGPKNMELFIEADKISVKVKPFFLPVEGAAKMQEIELLKRSITDGKITTRPNGLALNTDLEAFVGWGRSKLKEKAKKQAAIEGIELEEFIIKCIEEYLKR